MSRNKINSRIKSRGKARRSPWRGLFRIVLAPVRYWPLTILIAVAALLYWQWGNIVFWGGGLVANVLAFVANTLRMFGWGLLLIAAVMLTLIGVVRWGKASSFVRYGNRWLGVVVLALAAWGILAFFNLGGSFGMDILGIRAPGFLSILVAVLRVLGLVVLGVILIAPRASLRLLKRFISRVGNQLKRHPVPRLARTSKGVVSPVTAVPPVATSKAVPVASNLEREPEKKAVSSAAAVAASFQRELKQVAQEVWKKYGESPDRVDVDGWQLPPIDILDTSPEVQFSQADNVQRARLIEEALGSYGVEARVVQINAGPTVTQFGVEPGWDRKVKEVREKDKDGNVRIRQEEISKTRVKVERINSLANDLALALAAPSIRIEAPVPGKAVVGIEVPNTVSSMVSLRGVIETSVFQKMEAKSKLSLALGKGAGGEAVAADLTKMPHLLIAGATGSGKTVCLNAIVSCLLLYNTPNDVRFIMIDPKRVELVMFNGIPHLINPVIV
ncbi:MAG: DNA translocase FtsK, partial [Dehalococcoidales bacterium]|nr:DNA translocase FtsK [Dehalococcoidales bacterium]